MPYYRLTRTKLEVEYLVVYAGNKSDAKQIALKNIENNNLRVINRSHSNFEIGMIPDIVEDSALNCDKYFE